VYVEDAAPLLLDASLSVVDPEQQPLQQANVTILSGCSSGDSLNVSANVSAAFGIAVTPFSLSTCMLLLTGSANASAYTAVLQTASFLSSSTNPSGSARVIAFGAQDSQPAPGMLNGNAWSVRTLLTISFTLINGELGEYCHLG
jgi:hypothetical protein